jgi:hypothetical protein
MLVRIYLPQGPSLLRGMKPHASYHLASPSAGPIRNSHGIPIGDLEAQHDSCVYLYPGDDIVAVKASEFIKFPQALIDRPRQIRQDYRIGAREAEQRHSSCRTFRGVPGQRRSITA